MRPNSHSMLISYCVKAKIFMLCSEGGGFLHTQLLCLTANSTLVGNGVFDHKREMGGACAGIQVKFGTRPNTSDLKPQSVEKHDLLVGEEISSGAPSPRFHVWVKFHSRRAGSGRYSNNTNGLVPEHSWLIKHFCGRRREWTAIVVIPLP